MKLHCYTGMETEADISLAREEELLEEEEELDGCGKPPIHQRPSGTLSLGDQDGGNTHSLPALSASSASSTEVILLTTALVELTNRIQPSSPLVEDLTGDAPKRKRTASSSVNNSAVPAKKGRHVVSKTKGGNSAHNAAHTHAVKSGESSGDYSMSATDNSDCQGLYNAVLNGDSDNEEGALQAEVKTKPSLN